MSEPLEIRFTGRSDDFLSFQVLGRSNPGIKDYSGSNLLAVEGFVSVSVFQGNVSRDIHLEELQAFSESLSHLHETLTGEALLEPLDGWLKLRVEVGKLGQIKLSGDIRNGIYDENSLHFVLYTDQTFLNTPMRQIKHVLKHYPC